MKKINALRILEPTMKCFYTIVLLLFICTISVSGQITKKAQVGFRFLENPVSAEVVGRGGVGVTTTFNSNSIFWNPALLSISDASVDLNLNHTKGIADINYNAVAASFRIGNFGVVGVSLLAMDYGTFYGTYLASNEKGYVETGTFSPSAYAVGIAFSQKITDRFSYGVHIKYIHQELGSAMISTAGQNLTDPNLQIAPRNYSSSNFSSLPIAIDVGAYYDFLYNSIRFGASLQNISREYKYETDAFPMPFSVNFGLSVDPFKFFDMDKSQSLLLCFESRHPRDFGEKAKFGAEYSYLGQFIARVGYMTNYDERGFTFGAGVKQEISGVPLRVDYAYQPFGVFGGVHYLTLGVSY